MNITEIIQDVDRLTFSVKKCEIVVPKKVFDITSELHNKIINQDIDIRDFREIFGQIKRLTEEYQEHCSCTEKRH